LPTLTSSNFSVVYPEGQPLNPNAGVLTGWDSEIALDIQSAHAIAPGAKILVVASSGQDNEDQINSLSYIISKKLAKTVSSSWRMTRRSSRDRSKKRPSTRFWKVERRLEFHSNSLPEMEETLGWELPWVPWTFLPTLPMPPVWGTSVLNNPYGSGQIVTGWGNNIVYLNDFGSLTLAGYYFGGAGGGQSQYFSKPRGRTHCPARGGRCQMSPRLLIRTPASRSSSPPVQSNLAKCTVEPVWPAPSLLRRGPLPTNTTARRLVRQRHWSPG